MSIIQTIEIFFAEDALAISLILALVWFFARTKKNLRVRIALFGLFSLCLSFVLSLIAAKLYNDPRPFAVGHFTPLITHSFDNGFPSDHTLPSATVAAIVWKYDKKAGTILLILAIIIGVARVLVGVHHVIDIIGSVVIAIVSVAVVTIAAKNLQTKKKRTSNTKAP